MARPNRSVMAKERETISHGQGKGDDETQDAPHLWNPKYATECNYHLRGPLPWMTAANKSQESVCTLAWTRTKSIAPWLLMIQAFGSWTLFWDIYKLLWWFPLGFELLNPNPFGARLQILSIFFYSPFFQDGRQNLESCISWLADVIESSAISLNVCSWDQGIYFFENYSL